ncbi:hypothetical protein [Longispora albida]|nr:hypothetical protein [Longispora albida]
MREVEPQIKDLGFREVEPQVKDLGFEMEPQLKDAPLPEAR